MRLRGGFAIILGVMSLTLWSCRDENGASTSAPGVVASATPYAVLPAATIVAVVPPPPPPPAPTPRPTPTPERVTYKVAAGDIPGSIAAKFDISTSELLRANNITNSSGLQIGQELIIPGVTPTPGGAPAATATPKSTATAAPTATPKSAATATPTSTPTTTPGGTQVYIVVAGDTAIDIASKFGITVAQLAAANSTTEAALRNLQIGQRLTMPVR
ncbi:MAG: LysM peptidoglycan-binding domain-containing protein [Dehalococcoidia bacterium]|nr:LysM peptidoglycan-binding domain-containing protein [Dehalococcoidia bacterium]